MKSILAAENRDFRSYRHFLGTLYKIEIGNFAKIEKLSKFGQLSWDWNGV